MKDNKPCRVQHRIQTSVETLRVTQPGVYDSFSHIDKGLGQGLEMDGCNLIVLSLIDIEITTRRRPDSPSGHVPARSNNY